MGDALPGGWARLDVVPHAAYREPFERCVRRFKWIAAFARIDFYLLLTVQAALTAVATAAPGLAGWEGALLACNVGALLIAAVLAAVPLQRVDVQCTQAAGIIEEHLLTRAPLPVVELRKISGAATLCCLHPLRLGTTAETGCYWLACDC